MNLSSRLVLLLLTAPLAPASEVEAAGSAEPLTGAEWARLVYVLGERGSDPAALLDESSAEMLLGDARFLTLTALSSGRLRELLGRGARLLEKLRAWRAENVWLLTQVDPDYPTLLTERLGSSAPTVLFGVGPRALFTRRPLIGAVGPNVASARQMPETTRIAALAREAGATPLVSLEGGTEGLVVMTALEEKTGAAVFVDGSLIELARKREWAKAIDARALAVLSATDPDAPSDKDRTDRTTGKDRNQTFVCAAASALLLLASDKGAQRLPGFRLALQKGWGRPRVSEHVPEAIRSAFLASGAAPLADLELASNEGFRTLFAPGTVFAHEEAHEAHNEHDADNADAALLAELEARCPVEVPAEIPAHTSAQTPADVPPEPSKPSDELPAAAGEATEVAAAATAAPAVEPAPTALAAPAASQAPAASETPDERETLTLVPDDESQRAGSVAGSGTRETTPKGPKPTVHDRFYGLFLAQWGERLSGRVSEDELAETLGLHKKQAAKWLKSACAAGDAARVSITPKRFTLQRSLFSEEPVLEREFLDLFLSAFERDAYETKDTLQEKTGLESVQVRDWLKAAEAAGRVVKKMRPVGYRLQG